MLSPMCFYYYIWNAKNNFEGLHFLQAKEIIRMKGTTKIT